MLQRTSPIPLPPALIRLCYVSEAALPNDVDPADEIARILSRSRWWNARVGITGALFFNRTLFAQVLEGPREEVERLFTQISGDPRHSRVIRIDWRELTRRSFADWNMAFVGCRDDDHRRYSDLVLGEDRAGRLARDGMLGLIMEIVRNRENGIAGDSVRADRVVEALESCG